MRVEHQQTTRIGCDSGQKRNGEHGEERPEGPALAGSKRDESQHDPGKREGTGQRHRPGTGVGSEHGRIQMRMRVRVCGAGRSRTTCGLSDTRRSYRYCVTWFSATWIDTDRLYGCRRRSGRRPGAALQCTISGPPAARTDHAGATLDSGRNGGSIRGVPDVPAHAA